MSDVLKNIDPDKNFYRITNHNTINQLCLVAINYDANAPYINDPKILNLTSGVTAKDDTLESDGTFDMLRNAVPVVRTLQASTISFSPNTRGVISATLVGGGAIEFPLNSVYYIKMNGHYNQVEFGVLDLEHIS
ncbi:MAG: hypothetical protein JWO03_2891 [Bacteroidetes bacterium]|nr:hypothetical protein [Bacteroidota bacterium]